MTSALQHPLLGHLLASLRGPRPAPRDADWEGWYKLALRHRLVCALHATLKEADEVPQFMRDRLRLDAERTLGHNLFLCAELHGWLRRLRDAGIDAIPFKGVTLAQQAFGSLGARMIEDADLMVAPEEVREADAVLRAGRLSPEVALNGRRLRRYLATQAALAFSQSGGTFSVDMHWGLVPARYSFAPRIEIWRTRLVPVALPGGEVRTFSAEDTLLMLCLHGTRHGWHTLSWLHDLAGFLRACPKLDGAAVRQQAESLGLACAVALPMRLLRQFFETPIPEALATWGSEEANVERLAAQVATELDRGDFYATRSLTSSLVFVRCMAKRTDRVRAYTAPTIDDWKAVSLPGWLCRGYYLVRPLRLLTQHLRRRLQVTQS